MHADADPSHPPTSSPTSCVCSVMGRSSSSRNAMVYSGQRRRYFQYHQREKRQIRHRHWFFTRQRSVNMGVVGKSPAATAWMNDLEIILTRMWCYVVLHSRIHFVCIIRPLFCLQVGTLSSGITVTAQIANSGSANTVGLCLFQCRGCHSVAYVVYC